ncbi:MAG: hypothetical protein ISS15_09610 [Alphaproteobacteria bacterium]|nr:hypothetical protein [Alphaproteobacteria bacterium]MBL7097903.1 hypothetical protein [Alphaproteobacteria bacterium]
MIARGEVDREARRLFRTLRETGAHLARQPFGGFLLLSYGADGKYLKEKVSDDLAQAFFRRGWIAATTKGGRYVLSDAGAGWYDRQMAKPDNAFAAQHQIRTQKRVRDDNGRHRTVTVDEAESHLTRLRHRGQIDATQFDAGEKLRRDFTLAQLMPRMGVDLTAPVQGGQRSVNTELLFTDTIVAARQRFNKAMRAVGPGLSDLLFDIVCHLRGLEDAERTFGWPRSSARIVLGIALNRLADHYGLRVTTQSHIRSWSQENEQESA